MTIQKNLYNSSRCNTACRFRLGFNGISNTNI